MQRRAFLGHLLKFSAMAAAAPVAAACGGSSEVITIYAGRSQNLVDPILRQFVADTGIKIRVKYGDGTDLALGILEEGNNSPADVYYGQDVGAFGVLKKENRLAPLSSKTLGAVGPAFKSPDGLWVGISGRARVIVYNTDKINPATLPSSIFDYTQPGWRNRLGIVPRSDGFPEFVTAVRLVRGEDFARRWLTELKANNPRTYPNNLAALQAVANAEVEAAFLNHYYLYRMLAERGESFKARNYFFTNGDLGGIFLVAGAAVLNTSRKKPEAERFIQYLHTPKAQKYFADATKEYPLVDGVETADRLPPASTLNAPVLDLSNLTDLEGSLKLMRETGILP
jgi:iron(III) transport system substrate-binding protein